MEGLLVMNFGGKIKLLRQGAGYTQEELAKKLGLSKSTIAHYESGRREPDTKTIIKIANIFNVSTDEILDNVSFKNNPKIVLYGEDGKLVDISDLSKEDQDYILGLAERFKKEHRR
jgi:transcriptional regulator with XRE-family HTH domain